MTSPFAPSPFFVLRTPLLPADAAAAWSDAREAAALPPDAPDAALAAALARDRARAVAGLRALVARPDVREALFVASPSLDEALRAWLEDPAHPRAHDVPDALLRYLTRMSARPTPFGLFSGCSTGSTGARTRLAVAPEARWRRHTRLDMHYLCALTAALEREPAVRAALRFAPSTGLYPSAGQLRYAEGRVDPDTRERRNDLVSAEATDYLLATLARAAGGATLGDLADALAADTGAAPDEARAYVDELVESQLLVSDLAPAVTGDEPARGVVACLRARAPEHPAGATLGGALDALRALDATPLGADPARYRAVADALAALPAPPDLARLFQVDLYKPAPEATLGRDVLRALAEGVALLQAITEHRDDPALRRFVAGCAERYGGGAVPLTDALDEERGVGFGAEGGSAEPSPLLRGLAFPPAPDPEPVRYGAREVYLQRRVEALARAGQPAWALDALDLAALAARAPARLPDAFAVMATVVAASPEALAAGDFRVVLHGAAGPSGARLLGRFCHGDPELRAHVEAHLRAEEALRPDAVFAEVVHLPQGRLGNVICRPVLRGHEVPYLGRSGAPRDRQLAITDLRVAVPDPAGERVVLRSASLDREVLVRLSTAHDFGAAELALYRFLGALQSQGAVGSLGWSWGPLGRARALPRVTHGRVVLALARWTVTRDDLAPLARATTDAARYRAVARLREDCGLPRRVAVADGDNVLPLDLESALGAEAFAKLVRHRDEVTLTEVFPGPEDLCVAGPEGRFAHELVVPFVRTEGPSATGRPERVATSALPRSFPPGSEWLYAVLSTGTLTADAVLAEVVRPLVDEALASGAADGWFFIRYADPHWQVRVRLHGDPARLAAEVLPRLHALAAPLLGDGRVWRLTLGSYERETERYGGDAGIALAEAIFHADSDAALAIVETLSGDAGADARWRLALRGVHDLLGDLGLDVPQRVATLARVRAALARRHHADSALEAGLSTRYREERASLEALLAARAGDDTHPLAPGLAALARRAEALAPWCAELRRRAGEGALLLPVDRLAESYIHMWTNRVLRSDHLAQELVIYDFLQRLYRSAQARARAGVA